MRRPILIAVAATTLALLAPSRQAAAQTIPNCSDATMFPNPVFLSGDTDVQASLSAFAAALAQPGQPVNLIFQAIDSCTAIDRGANARTMTGTATVYQSATTGTVTCQLDAAGTPVTFGLSGLFASSCPGITVGSNARDFRGPVVVDELAVPKASTRTAISAKAAYFVFGFGAAGMVTPWTNESFLLIRQTTSGLLQRLAADIHVPPAKWKGMVQSSTGTLLNNLVGSTNPEASLGILTAASVDANSNTVTPLAYRDYLMAENFEQQCAYLPDTSLANRDKRNVRDGHYPLWGYLHVFTQVDASGNATNARVAAFIDLFDTSTASASAVIPSLVSSGLVPACAMHVSRANDGGALASYAPPQSCGCYFEYLRVGAAAPGCAACTTDATCGGSRKCRFGFCDSN
jgi:hypothetical protein